MSTWGSAQEQLDWLQAEVTRRMAVAVQGMQVRSGHPAVTVTGGWPVTVMDLAVPEVTADGNVRTKEKGPMRFVGNTLVVLDEDNGVSTAGVDLTSGTTFTATVLGESFADGKVEVPDVRLTDGGVFTWRFEMGLSIVGNTVQVLFSPDVNLVHGAVYPGSALPTVRVTDWQSAFSMEAVLGTGYVHQLAGVYWADGKVLLFQDKPVLDSNVIASFRNNGWFEMVA